MNGRLLSRYTMVGLVALIATVAAPTAQAGLGKKLVRGITYALSPNIGEIQNGPNADFNQFAQRFNYDPVTDGRSYEVTRFFGDDSFGNPETLNLGFLNVQLRQPDGSGLQGAGIYSRVGYNRRLIPEVYWDARTTGRNFSTFAGAGAVSAPLQYRVETNNGLESGLLFGTIQVDTSGSVNAFGFYNVDLAVVNTGTLTTRSYTTEDRNQDVSFDIGPVNLSGNIFVDQALGLLDFVTEQLGVPPEQFSVLTLRERTPDEITAAIEAGESVSAAEFNSLIEAYLANPETVILPNADTVPGASPALLTAVPEPGTLLLLAGGLAVLSLRRARSA